MQLAVAAVCAILMEVNVNAKQMWKVEDVTDALLVLTDLVLKDAFLVNAVVLEL